MIKIIIHAFIENGQLGVVEALYASTDENSISNKMAELEKQFPNDYLAVYDLPLNTDLNKLDHYPSVAIGKEEFGEGIDW
ncbi:phosphoribosylaminoimidazole carboxylase [Streptococcus pluranimalium]|uniref:phosphoribosylaminoimidazole carboxylase n=1 Tax=Streptococcus pluranimalium TaxID=82348 RepID=UPI0039FCE7D6